MIVTLNGNIDTCTENLQDFFSKFTITIRT